jgi:hypothetical protein
LAGLVAKYIEANAAVRRERSFKTLPVNPCPVNRLNILCDAVRFPIVMYGLATC